MDWRRLLSRKRVPHSGNLRDTTGEFARSVFERDWDRVLFSNAFRRTHDKTQVFPLPEDDIVHSRLTHSLEVASVGRSLGKRVGKTICERHTIDRDKDFDHHDVGDVVAAACLAHDIGNPPFGHAGEDAIATYFRSTMGRAAIASLAPREIADFQAFEGNAQGFRLLSRLQLEEDGGLQLTAATLGAFCKYPRESGNDFAARAATKKHGVFQHDYATLEAIAVDLGLPNTLTASGGRSWARHPLAFLVEAADDICYSILDIEDGVRLRLINVEQAEHLLKPLAVGAANYSADRLTAFRDWTSGIGYLRALAIGRLLDECACVFLDEEPRILNGAFSAALSDVIPSKDLLKDLKRLARERCYRAVAVLEIEMAGYEALGGLLAQFVPAVTADASERGGRPEQEQKVLHLLTGRGVLTEQATLYERILRVTDYVSGMTDRHALETYRRLKGIALPGRSR